MTSAAMFMGVLLDVLETAVTYPDLPNVEFTVFIGDRPTPYVERDQGRIKPGPYTPVMSMWVDHATASFV